LSIIEPPPGPAMKIRKGPLFNTVRAARECLARLEAWGRNSGDRGVTMQDAGDMLGINKFQAEKLLGAKWVPLTTLWRYVEWVRMNDVHQDVACSGHCDGIATKRAAEKILPGKVWPVPWRGGTKCARYEDVLTWRKLMRLEALAGPAAIREIGLPMMLAWAQLPAAEAAVMVSEAAGWALFDKRSRGARHGWQQRRAMAAGLDEAR